MLGDVVLMHGVTRPMTQITDGKVAVYLPQGPGGWYSLHDGSFLLPGKHDVTVTMENIPAYCRAGSIVPLKTRARRSSTSMWLDPFTLSVYLDPSTGEAHGRVYIDDYKTQTYQDGSS